MLTWDHHNIPFYICYMLDPQCYLDKNTYQILNHRLQEQCYHDHYNYNLCNLQVKLHYHNFQLCNHIINQFNFREKNKYCINNNLGIAIKTINGCTVEGFHPLECLMQPNLYV